MPISSLRIRPLLTEWGRTVSAIDADKVGSMKVFERIVVGVDGTDWGFEALRQALVLARTESAVLHAVTALDTALAIHGGFQAGHLTELLATEAEEAREEAEAIMGGREGFSARVVRGKPIDVLRHERDELQATLVALGGRRSSRFLGIMLGDTGTELVHDAVCSALLACPPESEPWRPRRIVVGFDGSPHAQAALREAEKLAAAFDGTVEVVAATGGKEIARDATGAERVDTWDAAHPVAVLVERSRSVDLVVVGSRGVHGIRTIGSVSERVAHQAHCTALVVHEPQTTDSS
jgi:nucleotide-binding universal stress UspA family protein